MSTTSEEGPLKRGDYAAAIDGQLRGPCPFVNSLANHGYIARDGRNVHAAELTTAVREAGLSSVLTALFVKPIFLEYQNPNAKPATPTPQRSFFGKIWYYLSNPWAILSRFGMRNPDQFDTQGRPVLNLDQLALHGVVEHDISLSRHDIGQGDNLHKHPELIEAMLATSSDPDKKYMSTADFAAFRNRRIVDQRAANPGLTYGKNQHQIACGEIALILGLLGDGKKIRSDFVRSFFLEERFPVKEGWKGRQGWWWWKSYGVLEFAVATEKVKKLVGLQF